MNRWRWVGSIVLGATCAMAARATTPKVEVAIEARKEIVKADAAGKRTVELKPATEAAAGDVLVYTLRATNTGSVPAIGTSIEDPIPAGTVLLVDSLTKDGYRVEASLDGGKSWQAFPVSISRKSPAGSDELVPAPAESYTTLRWILNGPLQPGDGQDVSFKVRIR